MWTQWEVLAATLSLIGFFLVAALLGFAAKSCRMLAELMRDSKVTNKELREIKAELLKTAGTEELWKSIAQAKEAVKEAKERLASLPPEVREELIKELAQASPSSKKSKAVQSHR